MTRQRSRLRPQARDFLLRYASARQAEGSRLRQAAFANATASQGLRRAKEVRGQTSEDARIFAYRILLTKRHTRRG